LVVTAEHSIQTNSLPLLGYIAAGEPIEALEVPETINVPPIFIKPDNFVLQVTGDSMIDDNIADGDYIIVQKTAHAEQGQIIVALINGTATLKRYYKYANRIELHPRNPEYPIIKVKAQDDFQINGLVLYSFRNY